MAIALALLAICAVARSEVFEVTSVADSGPSTLRWAITEANADGATTDEV